MQDSSIVYLYGGKQTEEYSLELYFSLYPYKFEKCDDIDEKILEYFLNNIDKFQVGRRYEFGNMVFFILKNSLRYEDRVQLPEGLLKKAMDLYLAPSKRWVEMLKKSKYGKGKSLCEKTNEQLEKVLGEK